MKLYTKTGDDGTTSIIGGTRVKKNCDRLEAYGTIDELSSFIGMIAADTHCDNEVKGQLIVIQHKLFDLGTVLASPDFKAAVGISDSDVKQLEGWIDALTEQTPPQNSFILPGGCEMSARAHQARTVCRRAERAIVTLAEQAPVEKIIGEYVNRLSDYLFILARYANFICGVAEIPYRPKNNI